MNGPLMPAWLRWTAIALATLLLCSCRSGPASPMAPPALQAHGAQASDPASLAPVTAAAPQDSPDQAALDVAAGDVALAGHYGPAVPPESARMPYVPATGAPMRPHLPGGYVQGYVAPNTAPLYYPPAYTLPMTAYTGGPHDGYTVPGYGGPLMMGAAPHHGPPPPTWAPPGIARPWPPEEYLCDGGDKRPHVRVSPDKRVYGLELEDTIAHFDTLDGRTIVEPSNCVCLYAPRFAAVRKIYGARIHEQHQRMAGIDKPVGPNIYADTVGPESVNRPIEPIDEKGVKTPIALLRPERIVLLDRTIGPIGFVRAFMPYEDLAAIREGIYKQEEKARLAEATAAARAWSDIASVKIILDEKVAHVATAANAAQETVEYRLEGEPKLKLCKIASKCAAQPGEIVEFTLRYDNIGTQPLNNVTILDNLTTRFEYVPDSAQSSREAQFFVEQNEAESLVLRWQLAGPLKIREGGVIRFKVRVR